MEFELRVVVIDGEPLERGRLLACLDAVADVEVVGALSGDWSAVDAVRRLAPDVIFIEARLPACTGFELLSALGPNAFSNAVFVTREREHAVRAFEVGVLDYIVKPVHPERVEMALARWREGAGLRSDGQAERLSPGPRSGRWLRTRAGEKFLERFPIKENGRVYFVRTSDIDWVESDENYVRIHAGGASHLVRRTLAQVETELDPARFARIHRSTIVNLERVREIQPGIGRYRMVLLENGAQLRLSERHYRQLVLRGYAYR